MTQYESGSGSSQFSAFLSQSNIGLHLSFFFLLNISKEDKNYFQKEKIKIISVLTEMFSHSADD